MGVLQLFEETTTSPPAVGRSLIYPDSADFGRTKILRPEGLIYPGSVTGPNKNYLINSGFEFAQRQTPGTLTSYFALGSARHNTSDGWQSTPENTNAQYQRVDTGGSGTGESGLNARYYGKWKKISTVGKLHVYQNIENVHMANIRGHKVRFQVKLRYSVATNMVVRLMCIQLTSSAASSESYPSTFISAHNGGGIDPTMGTNVAYVTPETGSAENGVIVGSGITCELSNSWVRYSGVWTVPSTCRNVGFMVVSNDQFQINDEINVAEPGVYDGPSVADWNPPTSMDEYLRCARYFQKTFSINIAPVQAAGVTTGCLTGILGKAGATALAAQLQWRYRVPMRTIPTNVLLFNPASANGEIRQVSGTASDLTGSAVSNSTSESADITATGVATGAVGDQVAIHATADASF